MEGSYWQREAVNYCGYSQEQVDAVAGEIDATVVSIFKKWGFAWGGDWSWTDPMHFELERLVRARR